MTNCPPRLRGDLSKWLCEINTGVYVGNVSSRVRDALWDRVCQNLKNGQATLVFTTAGEQRMDFRTHNTTWAVAHDRGAKQIYTVSRHPDPEKGELTYAQALTTGAQIISMSAGQASLAPRKKKPTRSLIWRPQACRQRPMRSLSMEPCGSGMESWQRN